MVQRVSHGDDRSEGGEIDLRALGRGVWRRKLWILGPALVAALAALLFVQTSSPYYRSSALVLIENRESLAPRAGERELQLPDEQTVQSQVQFIQSRDLVRSVVRSLNLSSDPEFAIRGDGLVTKLLRMVGLAGAQDDLPFSERVVDKVASNLTVYPVTGSRVVGLEFVSTSPDTAARVVNGFLEAYLDVQREEKRQSNKQASDYLSDEIAGLRERVGEAEGKVEAFRAKAGLLIGSNNTTLAAQQLGDIVNQLSASRTQRGEAQAKADTIRTLLRQGRPADALDIANSDVVRALAQERSRLAAQIASEGRTLLPQHPRMREIGAQLQGLEQQIRVEAEKMARAFENESKTAGARVEALEKRLDDLKDVAATANKQDVQLRALEREARSQRDLLEQMLARFREAAARENPESVLADARVISRGAAPTEAYFPKKAPTIALAALAAFALALFSVAAVEVFGGPSRREDSDAAPPPTVSEVPVFGRLQGAVVADRARAEPASLPVPTRATGRAQEEARSATAPDLAGPADKTVEDPDQKPTEFRPASLSAPAAYPSPEQRPSARAASIEYADATLVAALARQLAAMPTGDGALRLLTTGAAPDLAVAAVANKLAGVISSSGRRVVMVDVGGGAPRAASEGPGLAELLAGDATFAQAIHRDPGSRVHVVPAGGERFATLDAASKSRLDVVLDALALTYDFVMLTTPSGVGGADPFAAHCSAAVLVSNAGAADAVTVEAHERMRKAGIEDVVVLLVSGDGGSPRGRSLEAA